MLAKTVLTAITTDTAGNTVEALPVFDASSDATDIMGRPVDPVELVEDENGVRVRYVETKAVQDTAGNWIDATPVTGGGVLSALYNYSPAQFSAWREGKARVAAGTGRGKAIIIDNSTGRGVGGGDGGGASVVNLHPNSYPSQMALGLAARGVPANAEFYIGFSNISTANLATLADMFPGLSVPVAWTLGDTVTLGGNSLRNTADTNPIVYAPEIDVDRFKFYYLTNSGQGIINWSVDGGSATEISEVGSAAYNIADLSAGVLGAHTLRLARTSGNAWVFGVGAYDSAAKAIDILNCAWAGANASGFANSSAPWTYRSALAVAAADADIVLYLPTINDIQAGTSEATFKANAQLAIDTAVASGASVLLGNNNPINTTVASDAIQNTFTQYMKDLAVTNSLPFIDQIAWCERTYGGRYSTLNGLGLMTDSLHPAKAYYAAWGDYLAELLKAA